MNSKTVLSKILGLLSKDEVEMTYAKLADGTIVESATFDVGEDLFVVSEDGTKSPAPNGFHDLMLKDTEGNETLLKVKSEDGKIVERENVEMADAEMVKTQDIPAVGNEDKENVMPDLKGQVTSGTLKMAEETDEVMPLPEDTEAEDEAGDDEGEIEIELEEEYYNSFEEEDGDSIDMWERPTFDVVAYDTTKIIGKLMEKMEGYH
jgi:hypothetical protein